MRHNAKLRVQSFMNRPGSWLALLALSTGSFTLSAQTSAPSSVAEQYLFAAANAERTARGIGPLHWDGVLYLAAERHAREMAAHRFISHQYPGEAELGARARQAGVHFSVVAENVAEAPTAVQIHDAWMHSPGHRANLLDPRVDSAAISVIDRDGQLYAVEDFDRSVVALSLAQQEASVGALVAATAPLTILPADDNARRTCQMETGYAGPRLPWFVMRYTATDVQHLPSQLNVELQKSRYHQAMIAACAPRGTDSFTAFNLVVLLYP
jgi:uncharacterized protein YkwD